MTEYSCGYAYGKLKSNKLLCQRRDGKMMYDTLADEHVRMVLEKGIEHITNL